MWTVAGWFYLQTEPDGKPEWLGRQHVDIFFPNQNIGIEYQGAQHDKPIDFFGGEEAFKKNQIRDKRKKKLFQANDAVLIEVRPDYDFEELKNQIQEALNERNQSWYLNIDLYK